MLSFSTSNDKLKSKLLFVLACGHRLDVQKSITVRPIMASGGVAPVHSSRACKRQTDHMDNTVGQCVLGTCFSRPDRRLAALKVDRCKACSFWGSSERVGGIRARVVGNPTLHEATACLYLHG